MNIKLLICDDEKLIREGLASLDWDNYNIDVVGTAKNGELALELIREHKPDIVISDIRMPKKDGIWLAERIHEEFPKTRMIFLTGYNEFEYAQSAVNSGVSRYLLKPIDEDELYSVTDELAQSIRTGRLAEQKNAELRKMLSKSRYFLMNYLFNCAKLGTFDYELFSLPYPPKAFSVITVRLANETDTATSFSAFETIIKTIKDSITFIPFFNNTELVFIFCSDGTETDTEQILFNVCDRISEQLQIYPALSYNTGIGIITDSAAGIEDSYLSAQNALSYSSGLGDRNILYINDIEPHSQLSGYHAKLFDEYIKSLKNTDSSAITRTTRELFDSMKRSGTTLYNAQRRCLSLILAISDTLYDIGCNPAILFNNTDAWSLIKKTDTIAELESFITNITDVVIAHIEEMQRQKTQSIISKVKELVEKNYAEDASLETVASQVYISPCYLSVIFKKETNMTFKNYLMNTRIEKAKELLETTDLKIYEIAERVGYTDTRYFSELFARICGKTPSQYRSKTN